MKTFKNFFSRLFSLIRENRKDVFYFVLGIVFMYVMGVGFYHIGRKGFYATKYFYHAYIKNDMYDMYNYSAWLGGKYTFYENGSHSYVRSRRSGEKVLEDINWITQAHEDNDSLLCFASQGYRGYWNLNTGKVEVPANHYVKAWIFSEGLAAVMEPDSILKFINPMGEVVIDKQFKYSPMADNRGYLFKNSYCPMSGNDKLWGLIDKQGRWAVIPQYDNIKYTKKNCWICYKGGCQGVLDDSLRVIVSPECRDVLVTENGIEVLRQDYTRQRLDFNGKILERFMFTDVRDLYYKSGVTDPSADEYEYTLSPFKEYQTTYSSTSPVKVGLLGPDGVPVTPPLYLSIEAVNAECFRCFYDESGDYYEGEGASVLINKKGQVIDTH
jgi:hypothetical protein